MPCVYRRSMEICMRVSRIAVYTVYSSTQAESSLDRSSSKDSSVSNYRLGAGVKEIITCLTLFPLFFSWRAAWCAAACVGPVSFQVLCTVLYTDPSQTPFVGGAGRCGWPAIDT